MQCGGKNRYGKIEDGTVRKLRDGERESQRKVLGQNGEPLRSHLCGILTLLPQAAAVQHAQPPRAWPGRVPAGPPSLCPSVRQCARSSQLGHRPSAGGGAWMTSALPRPPLKPSERAPPRQALRSARGRALIPHIHPITSLTLLSLRPEGCALPRLSSNIQHPLGVRAPPKVTSSLSWKRQKVLPEPGMRVNLGR